MIDKEIVRNVVKNATKKQMFLCFSVESDNSLFTISQKYSINSTLHPAFARTVCHIILGFYKIEDTVPLLQQELGLDAKTAALLGADVLDFLAPLSDPNFVVPSEDDESVENTGSIASTGTPVVDSTWTQAPTTPEPISSPYTTAPTVTPEVHTMATDAHIAKTQFEPVTEPVYTSEQPVIRKPLSDTPSYSTPFDQAPRDVTPKAPIEPPRWGN